MVSKNFLKGHPKAGRPTNFAPQISYGEKIHTIRTNYTYWEKIVNDVNSGRGVLSLRQWEGKPYNSKPLEIAQLTKLGIQQVTIMNNLVWLNERYLDDWEVEKLAKNDGLNKTDFEDWFNKDVQAAIIHFTDFRY